MITIHQSQFLPWLPFINKIARSDVFVMLDHVQYQKNGMQNRNMIKTPKGAAWITVPVKAHLGDPINKVEVFNPTAAYRNILTTLELNYKKSKYFRETFAWLQRVLSKGISNLHDLNAALLSDILIQTKCKTQIIYSSQLNLTRTKDDLVIEIIKQIGQKQYLSGEGALSYMDLNKFKAEGIEVYLSQFNYTPYPQQWMAQAPFIRELSVVDLLFNSLPTAAEYINKQGSMRLVCGKEPL